MRVDLFDFDLPAELIALRPAKPRDSARLLQVQGDEISDRTVLDLPTLLRPGDTLVLNDTRVIPAQLEGRKGDARIGATLHKREGVREWWAFVRNAKRLRIGDTIEFGGGVSASVADRNDEGAMLLQFDGNEPVEVLLDRAGRMPLRPTSRPGARRTIQIVTTTKPCSRGRTAQSRRRLRPCISRRA